jgi:hypothetical protein
VAAWLLQAHAAGSPTSPAFTGLCAMYPTAMTNCSSVVTSVDP